MLVDIPEQAIRQLQQLDAVTAGRTGDFLLMEAGIDRKKELVFQILSGAVLKRLREVRTNPRLEHKK